MTSRLVLAVLAALALGCQRKVSGPQPALAAVDPQAVCGEQLTTSVRLSGSGLSPLITDGLTGGPRVELPAITLIPAQDLSGGAPSEAAPVAIPDDPADPGSSAVSWQSQEQMTFQFSPALQARPGLYSVQVANRNGQSAVLADALLVVPRPRLTAVVPELGCSENENRVRIEGDFFLLHGDKLPEVTIGGRAYAPRSTDRCRSLPGPAGMRACQALEVVVPQSALPAGVHRVSVRNPAPVGCTDSEALNLVIEPPPVLATVEPDLFCTAEGGVSLVATGTGFLEIAGARPSLQIAGASFEATLSQCEPVAGTATTVAQRCRRATALVGQGMIAPGAYRVRLQNPATAACASKELVEVAVVPPPSVSAIEPELTCSAGGARTVRVLGEGFIQHQDRLPTVRVGAESYPASAVASCAPLSGTLLPNARSCRELSFSLPSTASTGDRDLVVVNPSPPSCRSAPRPMYVAPRPSLATLAPAGRCEGSTGALTVTLGGSDFLTVGSGTPLSPTVTLGAERFGASVVSTSCTALGRLTTPASRCTQATIALGSTQLTAPGKYLATLMNPGDGACTSQETIHFSVTPRPTISGLQPNKICSQGGAFRIFGTNLTAEMTVRLISPTTPTLSYLASTVELLKPDGTEARATFTGPLTDGPYDVEVSTAAGGCDARISGQFAVTSGPVIFFVDPPTLYSGITTTATVYASGFVASGLVVTVEHAATGSQQVVASSFSPLKQNRIQITVPSGLAKGAYNVYVHDADTTSCPGRLLNAFTVTDALTMVISGVEPPFASTGAETGIAISVDTARGAGLTPLPRVYLNPATPGTPAIPLEAVAVDTPARATAVVPITRPELAGQYQLIVVNPDGAVGLYSPFRLVADPLPFIDEVDPSVMLYGQASIAFTATGGNFRSPTVLFRCRSASTDAETTVSATEVTSDATTIRGKISTSGYNEAQACLVEATNTDGTVAKFSAVVLTNPAKKLTNFKSGPALTTPRRAAVADAGKVTSASQFLYVVGGDDGAATPAAFASVEAVSLDLFGTPVGAFSAQRNPLLSPRSLACGARIGRFLYVAGGRSNSGLLDTVERAYLLNPSDRVNVTDLDAQVSSTSGLSAGLYYYRVSAVRVGTDALNPGGEDLPSDPFPISVPQLSGTNKLILTLHWQARAEAARYRIYRTVNPNDPLGTERLLFETTDATQLSLVDDGTRTFRDLARAPLPIGSAGVWHLAAQSPALAREGAGCSITRRSNQPSTGTQWDLYLGGGRDAAGTLLASVVQVPVLINAGGSHTVGTVNGAAGDLGAGQGRWQAGVLVAHSRNSIVAAGTQYLYVLGGRAGTGITSSILAASIDPTTGALGVFSSASASGMNPARAGFASFLANNAIFGSTGEKPPSGLDDGTTFGEILSPPPAVGAFSDATAKIQLGRFLPAARLYGAYIYIVGGATAGGTTASMEQIIW